MRRDPRWAWPAVGVIAAAAALAYGWGADHGDIQLYYAGAVRTMSTNWRLFALGGFDPTGTVTLDKLPGAFWIQALVVRAAGLSSATLIAPQVAAGALTVVFMFLAVRRSAGARAGVLAAAMTAAVPATAIMSRGNTADAICVLLVVVAADTTLRAVRNGRLRTVILAAVIVGLAFQAKMIEAWAVLPALAIAYAIAAPGRPGRRLGRLAIAGVVTAAVSLSWMVAVTLVPSGDRPYVDGSRHDSVFEQVFAYNAIDRFGHSDAYGLGSGSSYRPSARAVAYAADVGRSGSPSADQSKPGITRLVTGQVGRVTGWLVPAAFATLIGLLIARRHRPRTDPVRAGAILWGIWLLTFTVVFSRSAVLLPYYLGILTPAMAALLAIGLRTLYRSVKAAHPQPRNAMAGGAFAVYATATATAGVLVWRTPVWLVIAVTASLAIGAVLLGVGISRGGARIACAGFAALLVAPVVATIALVAADGGSYDAPFAPNGTLAQPAPHRTPPRSGYGGVIYPRLDANAWRGLDAERRAYAEFLTDGRRLAVFTSAQAAQYVVAGIPTVQAIGGYTGYVEAPSLDQIRTELTDHRLRYAVVPGPDDLRANDPRIELIEHKCRATAAGVGPTIAGPRLYVCG